MSRTLAAALALVALLRAPAPQELKAEVLDKLKAATVYVVVESGRQQGTGSGFLFLKRSTTAYFLTCEHVVGTATHVNVVLWSGTAQEKTVRASVVATDPDRDIACLIVRGVGDLPAPLEIGTKTEVKETEAVYAAGFPFGAMLASGKKNPEISISKSSVSSIRRDTGQVITAIQVSGEINPGNSGGPLVAADGRVLGVTASKIRGTTTAFAVPSEEIHGFLKSRVKSSKVRWVDGSDTKVRYEFTLYLVDPLASLKGVGVAYIDEKKISGTPAPEKDGTWKKLHADMTSTEFDIDEDRASETIEFKRVAGKADDLTVFFQCFYIRADGTTIWTEPILQAIEFTARGRAAGGREGDAAGVDGDEDATAPSSSPPVPTVPLLLPESISVVTEFERTSGFAALALAPDGSALYALDLSEGLLYKLDPDTLKIQGQVDVHPTATCLAQTPDGKTLYVGGRVPSYSERRDPAKKRGTLQAIDTTSFRASELRQLVSPIDDFVATDAGRIIGTSQHAHSSPFIYDFPNQKEEEIRGGSVTGSVRLSHDQKRVYIGDSERSPGDFHCLTFRKVNDHYPLRDSRYHGQHELGGQLWISPDGQFLIGARGSILRLGRTPESDLVFFEKIDPFQSAAMAPGCSSFFTITSDGFLKSFSLGAFKLEKSVKLGFNAQHAVLDIKRRKIHALFLPAGQGFMFERGLRMSRLGSVSLKGAEK